MKTTNTPYPPHTPPAAPEGMRWEYRDHPKRGPFKDITGCVYGKLTVLGYLGVKIHPSKQKSSLWACRCLCGNEVIVIGINLKRGNSTTCGCSRISHGGTNTPEYVAWEAMLQRCNNPKNPGYKNYGGRGIRVCKRWMQFKNFIKDMGQRPSSRHSLDRQDNSGNYTPDNCRWVLSKVQHRNKRTNAMVNIGGVSRCIAEWCDIVGMSPNGFRKRLMNKWSDEDLLSPPVSIWERQKLNK